MKIDEQLNDIIRNLDIQLINSLPFQSFQSGQFIRYYWNTMVQNYELIKEEVYNE